MTSLSSLDKVQAGVEAAAGTLVAATRLIPHISASLSPERNWKELGEVRGVRAAYDDVLVMRGTTLELEQHLDFEHCLLPFLCALQSVTPVGTNPYTWPFEPSVGAPNLLATATWEVVVNDGTTNHYPRRFGYARPTKLGITLGTAETSKITSTWMGRAEQALAAPAVVATRPRTVIPGELFGVWINDSWATLGTTKFGNLRSATLDLTPGLVPAPRLQGRADLDMAHHDRGMIEGGVSLLFDTDAAGVAEIEHWEGGDLRFVRLHAVGPVIAGATPNTATKEFTIDLSVRYIDTPNPLNADEDQHTVELNGRLRVDGTAAQNLFAVEVVNGVDAW